MKSINKSDFQFFFHFTHKSFSTFRQQHEKYVGDQKYIEFSGGD